MYKRPIYKTILKRLNEEPRRFMQILAGPRQTGKTTLSRQVADAVSIPVHYASADEPTLRDRTWIEQQWNTGQLQAQKSGGTILILDEIQKVTGWSETVKALWDSDTRNNIPLKVLILGSSPLLIQRGLTESLAGRFEIIPVPHWSFPEMKEAFGWNLDQYIYYGGYPASDKLISEPDRWSKYITDSLIETSISRDVLLLSRVDKPALLRRLFQLGCNYSGQILSYQKMVGQLQDAGNTTTLAHYLELLQGAGLLTGLHKFTQKEVKKRASSPKLVILNTALMSAQSPLSFDEARKDGGYWGRLVESTVGAHIINGTIGSKIDCSYWRERNHEVDYVLQKGKTVVAVEVKSGRVKDVQRGMEQFVKRFNPKRSLLVGSGGLSLEEFLSTPISDLC